MRISESDPRFLDEVRSWLTKTLAIGYASEEDIQPFVERCVLPPRPLTEKAQRALRRLKNSGNPFPESPYRPAQARLSSGYSHEASVRLTQIAMPSFSACATRPILFFLSSNSLGV